MEITAAACSVNIDGATDQTLERIARYCHWHGLILFVFGSYATIPVWRSSWFTRKGGFSQRGWVGEIQGEYARWRCQRIAQELTKVLAKVKND